MFKIKENFIGKLLMFSSILALSLGGASFHSPTAVVGASASCSYDFCGDEYAQYPDGCQYTWNGLSCLQSNDDTCETQHCNDPIED